MFFFFNDTATTEIYTLSLHDALPICEGLRRYRRRHAVHPAPSTGSIGARPVGGVGHRAVPLQDRKSTRLNSSHPSISYAVFCLKKKIKSSTYCCDLQQLLCLVSL